MPYVDQYIERDSFMTYRGITIWHTYYDDNYNSPRASTYSTDSGSSDDDDNYQFNVEDLARSLDIPYPSGGLGDREWQKDVIRKAIDAGLIDLADQADYLEDAPVSGAGSPAGAFLPIPADTVLVMERDIAW